MKIGDKIRILEDDLLCANVKSGDILEICDIDSFAIYCLPCWRFHLSELNKGFELLNVNPLFIDTTGWVGIDWNSDFIRDYCQEKIVVSSEKPQTLHKCNMVPYQGLTESYHYCTICDKKQHEA
jgi:hypothetical protein